MSRNIFSTRFCLHSLRGESLYRKRLCSQSTVYTVRGVNTICYNVRIKDSMCFPIFRYIYKLSTKQTKSKPILISAPGKHQVSFSPSRHEAVQQEGIF